MTEILSARIDARTRKRLDALAEQTGRSRSALAVAAIRAYVESEASQLDEIDVGIAELDEGRSVSHENVSTWLKSWGTSTESKAPQ